MVYLGPYGSAASRAEYARRVAGWLAAGGQSLTNPHETTVAEVVAAFRKHANNYYRHEDGNVSRTVENFYHALRPLLKLYGKTKAIEFGPVRLKAVRQNMIDYGRARTDINRHIVRIRHVFKWAVENEMIPPSVFHGLMAVSGLRQGRCAAEECVPVKPVLVENVHAILPYVAQQVSAMIQLQMLTGMRPGEVVLMRGTDIDTTDEVWVYRPQRHKTAVHEHKREVYIGKRSKRVLGPYLKRDVTAYLFSPAEAVLQRRERLHAQVVRHAM